MRLPFITIQSIRGGRKLNWVGFPDHKPDTVKFDKESGKPEIVQDYYCIIIGYAITNLIEGQKLYMKYTDAKELYRLLKYEFERG